MIQRLKIPSIKLQYLLASGCLLVSGYVLSALTTLVNVQPAMLNERSPRGLACTEIVQPSSSVTREQLAQLLSVPERSPRSEVQQIIKQPYCRLPSLSIRAGATTEREAYPLAEDPQTSVVVLYEGKSYVGYGFQRL